MENGRNTGKNQALFAILTSAPSVSQPEWARRKHDLLERTGTRYGISYRRKLAYSLSFALVLLVVTSFVVPRFSGTNSIETDLAINALSTDNAFALVTETVPADSISPKIIGLDDTETEKLKAGLDQSGVEYAISEMDKKDVDEFIEFVKKQYETEKSSNVI